MGFKHKFLLNIVKSQVPYRELIVVGVLVTRPRFIEVEVHKLLNIVKLQGTLPGLTVVGVLVTLPSLIEVGVQEYQIL